MGVAKNSAKLHAGRDEALALNSQPGVFELEPLASTKANESMPKNSCEKANDDGGSMLSCAIRNADISTNTRRQDVRRSSLIIEKVNFTTRLFDGRKICFRHIIPCLLDWRIARRARHRAVEVQLVGRQRLKGIDRTRKAAARRGVARLRCGAGGGDAPVGRGEQLRYRHGLRLRERDRVMVGRGSGGGGGSVTMRGVSRGVAWGASGRGGRDEGGERDEHQRGAQQRPQRRRGGAIVSGLAAVDCEEGHDPGKKDSMNCEVQSSV